MEKSLEQLKSSPIVEFILDIECDMPIDFELKGHAKRCKQAFGRRYPKFRHQFKQEFALEIKGAGVETPAVQDKELVALQFLQEDKRQLVQVRESGFSFNRLAPYKTLDDYFSDIEETWHIFLDLVAPLRVLQTKVRYINRILLPIVDGKCDIEAYLESAPKIPAGTRLELAGFVSQRHAIERDTGHEVVIVQAAQKPDNNELPVILDIATVNKKQGEPANWAWLKKKIMVLKELSLCVFSSSVTEKCLTLFQ